MRIAFFSEIGSYSGVNFPRNFENMRTDAAWAVALKAPIISLDNSLRFNSAFQPREDGTDFDLGIIIVPKKHPEKAFKCFEENRQYCKQWATMQEANQTYWQNWNISTQIEYLRFLQELDILYVHNEIDRKYFEGLTGKETRILPSLMIEDALPKLDNRPEERDGVLIGGNWCEWYSGQDSFYIAQEFDCKIYAPSMGRKDPYEDYLEDIHYLTYMNWQQWMLNFNKMKYAVHLMRTYAAGTFALNAAYVGVPCIGWGNGTDTQQILFPESSPDEGDMVQARKIAKHLKNNSLFYNHVSAYAKKSFYDNYSEQVFLDKFYEPFRPI